MTGSYLCRYKVITEQNNDLKVSAIFFLNIKSQRTLHSELTMMLSGYLERFAQITITKTVL